MLACPYCTRALERDDRFCPACHLALRFEPPESFVASHPKIERGTTILRRDFTRDPPPEMQARSGRLSDTVRCEEHARGVLFHVSAPVSRTLRETKLELRDCCVGASFTALGPGARVGLCARATAVGEGFTTYTLEVSIDAQTAWPTITFSAGNASGSTPLVQKTQRSPVIAGAGAMNAFELRVQGASLQAFANGTHLFSIHEPTYGIGYCGLRIGSDPRTNGPVEIVCHDFHVSEVAP